MAHKGHNDFFRSQLNNLRSQLTNLRSQLNNLRSQLTNLRSKLTNLRSQLTNLRSQLTNLRSQLINLRSQLNNWRSQLTNLQSFKVTKMAGRLIRVRLFQRNDIAKQLLHSSKLSTNFEAWQPRKKLFDRGEFSSRL